MCRLGFQGMAVNLFIEPKLRKLQGPRTKNQEPQEPQEPKSKNEEPRTSRDSLLAVTHWTLGYTAAILLQYVLDTITWPSPTRAGSRLRSRTSTSQATPAHTYLSLMIRHDLLKQTNLHCEGVIRPRCFSTRVTLKNRSGLLLFFCGRRDTSSLCRLASRRPPLPPSLSPSPGCSKPTYILPRRIIALSKYCYNVDRPLWSPTLRVGLRRTSGSQAGIGRSWRVLIYYRVLEKF